jgi:hypothetical protein
MEAVQSGIEMHQGRTVAQAGSCWLPTAEAWVRTRVWSSGIYGRQSGARAGYLRLLLFPLTIFITPNSPSSQSPWTGTISQKWPTCRVDPVWTPPLTTRIKKNLRHQRFRGTYYLHGISKVLTFRRYLVLSFSGCNIYLLYLFPYTV